MRVGLHNASYKIVRESTICQDSGSLEGNRGFALAARVCWCWRRVSSLAEVPPTGCYAVYHDGGLVYIGSSARLQKRVNQYLTQAPRKRHPRQNVNGGARRVEGVVVTVKVAGARRRGDWLMREYRLIQRLKPRDNGTFSGRPRTHARIPVGNWLHRSLWEAR